MLRRLVLLSAFPLLAGPLPGCATPKGPCKPRGEPDRRPRTDRDPGPRCLTEVFHTGREGARDDPSDTVARCTAALREDPGSAAAYAGRAEAYRALGRPYLAVEDYHEAACLDSRHEPDYRGLLTELREASPGARVLSVSLDEGVERKVVKKSPPLTLAPGTRKVVEDTVRVRHEATVGAARWGGVEARGRVRVAWLELEGGVRAGVERTTGRTCGVESERRRSVVLKGGGPPVRVVWVEYYRTGTARAEVGRQVVEFPFLLRDDFDLLTEACGDAPAAGCDQ